MSPLQSRELYSQLPGISNTYEEQNVKKVDSESDKETNAYHIKRWEDEHAS